MNQYSLKYISIIAAVLYMVGVYFLYPIWGNSYLMISIIPLILITWFCNVLSGFGIMAVLIINLFIASIVLKFDINLLLNHEVFIGVFLLIIIILGLYFLKRQITHLNTTESFLKNAKIRLDTMISNTSDIIGIMNPEGIIMFKTSNIEKFFGWKPEDLIGKLSWETIHPDDKERAIQDFQSLLKHKDKVNSAEYLYQCKNGSYKNIMLYAKNLIHNPHINGILINYRDITESKKSSLVLAENEYKYRTLFENSIDVVSILDMQGNIIDVNEAASALYGYTKEEIVTMNVKHLLHPDDREKSDAYFKKLAAEGAYSMFEGRIITKSGKVKWIQVNSTAFEKDGVKIGSQDIIRDITKQKEAETNLKALNATKDKLFSIISHDLRNPFNSILGFSDLIIKRIRNNKLDNIEEFATMINESAYQSEKLLDNLLEWSRLQTGGLKFQPENHNLKLLVSDEISLVKNLASNKQITVDLLINEAQTLTADKNMIGTVIRNLLSNAIKFTPNGGAVSIYADENKSNLTVSISDTGVGISTKKIPLLFDLEHTISTSGTNHEKGSGLGLVLCKEFIERHKGIIWVESQLGKGSTFFFKIPIAN